MLSSFLWPCHPFLSPYFLLEPLLPKHGSLVKLYKSTKQQKQLNSHTRQWDLTVSFAWLICVDFCLPRVVWPCFFSGATVAPYLWPRSSWVCLFCPLIKGSRCCPSSSSAQQVAVPVTWSLSGELGCSSMQLGQQLRWDLLQSAQYSVSGDLSHAQLCH